MNSLIFLGAILALIYAIARHNLAFKAVTVVTVVFLAVFTLAGGFSFFWGLIVWVLFLVPTIFLGLPEIRLQFLSRPLLKRIKAVLPPMSDTERDAIQAGSVWWEAELFRGAPNWGLLQNY